nr:hypothetical protein [uncultured Kingella sp.]
MNFLSLSGSLKSSRAIKKHRTEIYACPQKGGDCTASCTACVGTGSLKTPQARYSRLELQ